jgi:hypothetical protein
MDLQFYIDEDGFFRFKGSHILVHRWAAEQKLGRKLRDGEIVHHRDRNKLNNLPDNLYITNEHHQHIDTKRFGWKGQNGLN